MEKTGKKYEKEKTMTLFRQIAIAISLIFIIMLGSAMAINYQTAKEDIIQSLYETTVNSISTLANKLSDTDGDKAMIKTIIDSEFDSGYYKTIYFKSNDGEFNYKQIDNDPISDVPLWFIEFTIVNLKLVSTDVSSDWNILGEISILGDIGIVYKALYKMFINLSYIFFVSVIVSLIILYVMLYFILKPMYLIQHQAESILKNEFILQKKVPYTTEFKDVVKAMNTMVKKVEEIFQKGNEAVQRNRELLYNDPTTKLFNRRYLMLKLPDLIKLENKTNGGTVMFIALDGAEILNQVLGRQKADKMFFNIAEIFHSTSQEYENKVISRVNGTEFILILPDCDSKEGLDIASNISEKFIVLIKDNELDSNSVVMNIGIYKYITSISIGDLLKYADNALSQAKAKENSNIYLFKNINDENALGKEQWREIIEESIENNYFSLKFWPTLNINNKKLNHKVMTFTIDGGENKKYFYGDFIAAAINLGLANKMFIVALQDLIIYKHKELDGSVCSIRLSNEFIKDTKAFSELSELFNKYSKTINFKLSFEVSDTFAINNTIDLKNFVKLFEKHNFGFGINSFTGESNDFSYLKQLNPEFLKADCAFLLDQSQDSMSALHVITDSLSIEIIATYVKTKEELERLRSMHIHTVQGPITDNLT